MPGSTRSGSPPSAGHRVAHGGEIGDRRNAGEVLHQHARRHELQLAMSGLLRGAAAVGERTDVVGLHVDTVFAPQQVLEQNSQRVRERARVVDDRVEPEDVVIAVAHRESRPRAEAVECHVSEATLRLCGRRHCGRRRRHQAGGGNRRARTARSAHASTRRRRSISTADALFAVLTDLVDRLDAAGAVAVGVGCGGPDGRRRRARVAAQHPRVARVPAAGAARRAYRSCRRSSTTTPRRSRSARVGSARRRAARDYIGMVVSTGVGGGIVLDGRLLDGARRATPATSAT